jgi:hypothetical protein
MRRPPLVPASGGGPPPPPAPARSRSSSAPAAPTSRPAPARPPAAAAARRGATAAARRASSRSRGRPPSRNSSRSLPSPRPTCGTPPAASCTSCPAAETTESVPAPLAPRRKGRRPRWSTWCACARGGGFGRDCAGQRRPRAACRKPLHPLLPAQLARCPAPPPAAARSTPRTSPTCGRRWTRPWCGGNTAGSAWGACSLAGIGG